MSSHDNTASSIDARLSERIDLLLDSGWQPADLVHLARQHGNLRQSRLVVAALAHHSRRTDAAHRAPRAWVQQLADLGVWDPSNDRVVGGQSDFTARWAKAEKLHPDDVHSAALDVEALLRRAPRLAELLTPPARWGATNIGLPDDAAAAASMGSLDPKVLRTIRALLAQAEGTTFEAEAETFTTKAQELMTRHSIDLAMLAAAGGGNQQGPAGVISTRVHLDNPYAQEKATFLGMLAHINGVRCVWSDWAGFCTLVGFPTDVQLTEVLFTSLLVQATQSAAQAGRRDSRNKAPTFKRAFIVSFAQRIAERLEDAGRASREEAEVVYGSALAPVLASRKEAVEAAYTAAFPKTVPMKSRSYDAAGWWAGRSAADQADLGAGAAITRGKP